MTRTGRLLITAVGVALLTTSLAPLYAGGLTLGIYRFGWFLPEGPYADRFGTGTDVYTHSTYVETYIGPFTLSGDWAWAVPLAAAAGGLALLIWAWRAKPAPVPSRDRQGVGRSPTSD